MTRIKDRVLMVSDYILETNETIRQIGTHFNISKSTVFLDLTKRLEQINYSKYLLVKEILKEHDRTKHIKGGESTKNKYKKHLN